MKVLRDIGRMMVELWQDTWVGKLLALVFGGTCAAMFVLVALLIFACFNPPPPDPPGTTYTYEDSIQCQNTVSPGGYVGIACMPTTIRVPHYPTVEP